MKPDQRRCAEYLWDVHAKSTTSPVPSATKKTQSVDTKMGADAESAGATPQAFRDPQDAYVGDAQLAAGGREQRRDHGVRGVLEAGPQGKVRRRADGELPNCGANQIVPRMNGKG